MRSRLLRLLPALFCIGCRQPAPLSANVAVGSLSLHIVCRGQGRPVVVLDSGLANDARVWSVVAAGVAQTSTVCAYDRAGLGASSAAPRPHTNRMMADELSALLRNAELPRPYVFVGHSMGGVNIRLLAQADPDAVAGMVLVDAMSESQAKDYWSLIPQTDMDGFRIGLQNLPEGMDFETLSKGLTEVATTKPLGAKPLVVLSHDIEDAPPGAPPETAARLRFAWQRMQQNLSLLSSNRAYVVVTGTRHAIHQERPQVVVVAIREVIQAVREHRPVNESPILASLK